MSSCIASSPVAQRQRIPGPHAAGVTSRYVALSALPCAPSEVPDGWLSVGEQEECARLRHPARCRAWLGGRLLAKQLILETHRGLRVYPSMIDICTRDGLGRSCRPRVMVDGRLQDWSLSIAHSERSVLVAVAQAGFTIGVDVVPVRPLGPGFAALWLTPLEQARIGYGVSRIDVELTATIWAVKEACYKATNLGEPFAPRRFEALPCARGGWSVRVDGHAPARPVVVTVARTPEEVAVAVATGGAP